VATQADVGRIALALPGVVESDERFAFSVVKKASRSTTFRTRRPRGPPGV
jgi:hypothetical protein